MGQSVMGVWVVPPIAGLSEPAVAPEFFIEGVGAIERIGANVRLYCYARQHSIDAPDLQGQKTVVLKIVRPADTIGSALARMFKIMGVDEPEEPVRPAPGSKPELVR